MPSGNSVADSNNIINKIITQELQSNTQICSTTVKDSNTVIQFSNGSGCNNVAVSKNSEYYSIDTACFSNYKYMGKVTNDIVNSIVTTIEQKKTGMNLGGNNVNLQQGIYNIVNTYITQQNLTEIVNSFVKNDTVIQVCVGEDGSNYFHGTSEEYINALNVMYSQSEAVTMASTEISNYISTAIKQKSTGALVGIIEAIVVLAIVGLIALIFIVIIILIFIKMFT